MSTKCKSPAAVTLLGLMVAIAAPATTAYAGSPPVNRAENPAVDHGQPVGEVRPQPGQGAGYVLPGGTGHGSYTTPDGTNYHGTVTSPTYGQPSGSAGMSNSNGYGADVYGGQGYGGLTVTIPCGKACGG